MIKSHKMCVNQEMKGKAKGQAQLAKEMLEESKEINDGGWEKDKKKKKQKKRLQEIKNGKGRK